MAKAILLGLLVFCAVSGIAQSTSQVRFRLYLIGDAGKPPDVHLAYPEFLQQQLRNDTVPSAIVFLGDNIYPKGMPDESNQFREAAATNTGHPLRLFWHPKRRYTYSG